MSAEEKQELMNKNFAELIKQMFSLLILKYWTQTAGIMIIIGTCLVFYWKTRETNSQFPVHAASDEQKFNQLFAFKEAILIEMKGFSVSVNNLSEQMKRSNDIEEKYHSNHN